MSGRSDFLETAFLGREGLEPAFPCGADGLTPAFGREGLAPAFESEGLAPAYSMRDGDLPKQESPSLPPYTVLSSRTRLARNVEGVPFPHKMSREQASRLLSCALPVLTEAGYEAFRMADLSKMERAVLLEQGTVSPALAHSAAGAVAVKGGVSVMLLEEDVFRISSVTGGLSLFSAYEKGVRAERLLSENFPFAKMQEFGYLTASFFNVGAALRASVTVFLPALIRSGEVEAALRVLEGEGVTARGVLGEGSPTEHAMLQISNAHSFRRTEGQILAGVTAAATDLAHLEMQARRRLFSQNPKGERERFFAAARTLSEGPSLSYGECADCLCAVMEGISLGVLTPCGTDIVSLFSAIRPASLAFSEDRVLSEEEAGEIRAQKVRQAFALS